MSYPDEGGYECTNTGPTVNTQANGGKEVPYFSILERDPGQTLAIPERDPGQTLIHSFINSRIYYCNSLLDDLPKCHIDKLAPSYVNGLVKIKPFKLKI